MSASLPAFVSVLLRQGVLNPAQVEECRAAVAASRARWGDTVVAYGHATHEQVMRAWAEALCLRFIDLTQIVVAPSVVELVPESVARENLLLPVAQEGGLLIIAVSDPENIDVFEKLHFILNRPCQFALASHEQIVEAINRHYGQTETESVDSMLVEFTDTAIDFTETEASTPANDLDEMVGDLLPTSAPATARPRRAVERRATVRYYERMNPERLYPLLVVLSKAEVERVAQRNVGQKQSQAFQVETGSVVEIEPILPGCDCYPPRAQVTVEEGEVRAEFYVAPRVLGRILAARVVVRQEGRTLAEVPLEARVARQTTTWILAGLSFVLPFLLLLLKHFRLDFESQREEGYGLYAQFAGRLIQVLTPETLTLLLLAATAALYWCFRPRQRDQFWDIKFGATPTTAPAETTSEAAGADDLAALERGDRRPATYFRASLAAHRAGDTVRALVILRQAEVDLGPERLTGVMWYNMACFAALLRQYPAALAYLQNAVEAGYADAEKIRTDPDLAALRLSAAYKRLLVGLEAAG